MPTIASLPLQQLRFPSDTLCVVGGQRDRMSTIQICEGEGVGYRPDHSVEG